MNSVVVGEEGGKRREEDYWGTVMVQADHVTACFRHRMMQGPAGKRETKVSALSAPRRLTRH